MGSEVEGGEGRARRRAGLRGLRRAGGDHTDTRGHKGGDDQETGDPHEWEFGPARRESSVAEGLDGPVSNIHPEAMNLYDTPQISCPACHRMVPFDYVEIIGDMAVLACPHCSGVRVDLALEQVLARN
jgi:hypothetical protein